MILPGSSQQCNDLPFNYPYLLSYEVETNPVLDPLEAMTGFELMVGLMSYAVVWCGRRLAGKVTTWRKKWL